MENATLKDEKQVENAPTFIVIGDNKIEMEIKINKKIRILFCFLQLMCDCNDFFIDTDHFDVHQQGIKSNYGDGL